MSIYKTVSKCFTTLIEFKHIGDNEGKKRTSIFITKKHEKVNEFKDTKLKKMHGNNLYK